MTTIYYRALAQPAAQYLEACVTEAISNSRFQGMHNDITKTTIYNFFDDNLNGE